MGSWLKLLRDVVLSDLNTEILFGSSGKYTVVHKFGSAVLTTSFGPVAFGGVYRTPQPAAATALRIKAGDVNDTANGSGAREITLEGLNELGQLISVSLATAGASASAATSEEFIRLHNHYVSASGTYADTDGNSHAADIVVENAAGNEDWGTIDSTDFDTGHSEVAWYGVPAGKTACIRSMLISLDSNKVGTVLGVHRASILDAAAPYSAMRVFIRLKGITNSKTLKPITPIGPFEGPCDLGFLAKVNTGTGEMDIDFEIILKDT